MFRTNDLAEISYGLVYFRGRAGDQINVVRGNEVHAELVFHFRDGSIDDEVTDYRQGDVFELIRDHPPNPR